MFYQWLKLQNVITSHTQDMTKRKADRTQESGGQDSFCVTFLTLGGGEEITSWTTEPDLATLMIYIQKKRYNQQV